MENKSVKHSELAHQTLGAKVMKRYFNKTFKKDLNHKQFMQLVLGQASQQSNVKKGGFIWALAKGFVTVFTSATNGATFEYQFNDDFQAAALFAKNGGIAMTKYIESWNNTNVLPIKVALMHNLMLFYPNYNLFSLQ